GGRNAVVEHERASITANTALSVEHGADGIRFHGELSYTKHAQTHAESGPATASCRSRACADRGQIPGTTADMPSARRAPIRWCQFCQSALIKDGLAISSA